MGKIFIFLICLVAGGLYYLQHNFDVAEGGFKKKEKATGAFEEKKEVTLHKFQSGDCLTTHKDGWEFTKIYEASETEYTFLDCHQYKGCVAKKETQKRVEFEMGMGKARVIPCPSVRGQEI